MQVKLHEATFGEEEIQAAVEVLRSTMVTQGAKVKEFEHAFWSHGHAVACNSGSSANLLAISALKAIGRLKDGDEVIVSALSWSTTVFPLIQHNLIPVIVDCDPETMNIDVCEVVKALSPKTRAIMPVHVYGNPCDLKSLSAICEDNGLLLIEDCCEAMGAEYSGVPIGAGWESTIATFSFYFSHHITTIEGGMAVTKDADLADMMRIQRSHGWVRDVKNPESFTADYPDIDPRFLFVDLGYNLRMTELQAAIGLCQLPKLAPIVEHRRRIHALYRERLDGFPSLRFQKETTGGKSSCFGFNIILDGLDRADLTLALNGHGIETRPIICGNIALQPGMQKYSHRTVGDLGNATNVMRNGLSIGCHQNVSEKDVAHVVETIDRFICGRKFSNSYSFNPPRGS